MDKLGLTGEDEPELVHDFGVLSRVENARFRELYDAFRQDQDLARDELTEMQVLLDRCPLVDPSEAGNPYSETHEERHERRQLERAFAGAFHDYAKQYSYIAAPNYANRLNEYRLDIASGRMPEQSRPPAVQPYFSNKRYPMSRRYSFSLLA